MNIIASGCAFCVAFLLQVAASSTQQTDASSPKPQFQKAAGVRGRVLAAETQAPLQGARVTLTDRRDQKFVGVTDDKGEFAIGSLPPGGYRLLAVLDGRVSSGHEPAAGNLPASPLELAEGELLEDLQIELPRVAAITGVLSDENGKPVSGMRVAAMRPVVSYAGLDMDPISGLAENMYTNTDAEGRFSLDHLSPGTYYVAAFPTGHGRIFAGRNRFNDLPPTFFPGTYNPMEARAIAVSAGEEQLASFSISPTQLPRLTGRVLDESLPASGATVILSNLVSRVPSAEPIVRRLATASIDGTFTLTDVPLGVYKLLALTGERDKGNVRQATSEVTVRSGDVPEVILRTTPGGVLSGRLSYDGDIPIAELAKSAFIYADRVVPIALSAVNPERAVINSDGTFVMRRIYGEAFVRAGTMPPRQACLARVVRDGRDITDTPIDFDREPAVDNVSIEMTTRCSHLEGVVTDSRGRPAARMGVAAYASDAGKLYFNSRFERTAQTDDQGKYRLSNLPPNIEYFVVAGPYVAGTYREDPKNRNQISKLAATVVVRDGETATVNLQVVRWP